MLPESITIEDNCGSPELYAHGVYLHDDIAEAVLRDAMQSDAIGFMRREMFGTPAWEAGHLRQPIEAPRIFHDSDHGGSLGACYQAWRCAKGIA